MNIEEVAHDTPEKILKVFVDPAVGLTDAQATELAKGIGVPEASVGKAVAALKGLYTCYMETDASLAEINPLILEGDGNIKACGSAMRTPCSAIPAIVSALSPCSPGWPAVVFCTPLREASDRAPKLSDHSAIWSAPMA